jgi:DNA-nicking Smr family endonuclease
MPEKKPPPKSKSKPLRDDDRALWRAATADVKELQQKSGIIALESPAISARVKKIQPSKLPHKIPNFVHETKSRRSENAAKIKSSSQIDGALKKKFESGELPIDGKIDLHGMTLEQAHRQFKKFMTDKVCAGARCLLIVTGKGAGGEGVIRKSLPLWCEDGALRPHILQKAPAKPKHGGAGATYILLRRAK